VLSEEQPIRLLSIEAIQEYLNEIGVEGKITRTSHVFNPIPYRDARVGWTFSAPKHPAKVIACSSGTIHFRVVMETKKKRLSYKLRSLFPYHKLKTTPFKDKWIVEARILTSETLICLHDSLAAAEYLYKLEMGGN